MPSVVLAAVPSTVLSGPSAQLLGYVALLHCWRSLHSMPARFTWLNVVAVMALAAVAQACCPKPALFSQKLVNAALTSVKLVLYTWAWVKLDIATRQSEQVLQGVLTHRLTVLHVTMPLSQVHAEVGSCWVRSHS